MYPHQRSYLTKRVDNNFISTTTPAFNQLDAVHALRFFSPKQIQKRLREVMRIGCHRLPTFLPHEGNARFQMPFYQLHELP